MADVKVHNETSQQPGGAGEQPRTQPSQQQTGNQTRQMQPQQGRGTMTRRGEGWGEDFFTLSPFSLMRRLSEEMDRAFSTSFGLARHGEYGMFSPAVEVKEKDGNLVVCADLPGMKKDDVRVELTDEGLVIQGERKREHEEERGGWHRSERSYGQFYRVIPLPENVDADKAKADFKDGVLEVKIPVPEPQNKRREIPIHT